MVHQIYSSDQQRTLTEAVLDAIESHTDEDLRTAEYVLYDDIDPDGLNSLFRPDSQSETVVMFDTDDVRVKVWDTDDVRIQVTDRAERKR